MNAPSPHALIALPRAGTQAVAFVSLRPTSCSAWLVQRMAGFADSVLGVESFAGRNHTVPAEFLSSNFVGFLYVHKLHQVGGSGALAGHRPPGLRFGFKRDRRKLRVGPLWQPVFTFLYFIIVNFIKDI